MDNITLRNLQKKTPIPRHKILQATKQALRRLKLRVGDLSIVFVGRARMRAFNKKFLNHDYVTDVLTFNYVSIGHDVGVFGEIIICPQVAQSNAHFYKTSTERELILYVIHGLLHLVGYDDHKPADVKKMRAMEIKLISDTLPNPPHKREGKYIPLSLSI